MLAQGSQEQRHADATFHSHPSATPRVLVLWCENISTTQKTIAVSQSSVDSQRYQSTFLC